MRAHASCIKLRIVKHILLHDNTPLWLAPCMHQVDGAYEDWVEVLMLMYFGGTVQSLLRGCTGICSH